MVRFVGTTERKFAMTKITDKVVLGQEFFVLSSEGEVVRTMVGVLLENGYQFLDGTYSNRPHWLNLAEALDEAKTHLDKRRAKLRAEMQRLVTKRKVLYKESYLKGVMRAPFKVLDLPGQYSDVRKRTRRLKKVTVPTETYLRPGCFMFAAVTPGIGPRYDVYRPYENFVLEVKVVSVCFSPDGKVHYNFSTIFEVKTVFESRKAAEASMASTLGVGHYKVPFVSFEEMRMEMEKIDDIPF